MNREEFSEFLDSVFGDLYTLNAEKGHDYAGDENVFSNFERGAEKFGLRREQVLGIFLAKHLDAIDTWIREGKVQSEPIEGRIQDAVMYLLLLLGMTRADGAEIIDKDDEWVTVYEGDKWTTFKREY